jgi:hypothetical protein
MKRFWLFVVGIGVFVAVMVFAWFVWPTPYTYYDQQVSSGTRLLTRVSRFTGRVEFLYPGRGWVHSPVDVSKDNAKRLGEMQRRYPDLKAQVLWEDVRQQFIQNGFMEPWSEATERAANAEFETRAGDLQRRAHATTMPDSVTVSEMRFVRIAPNFIRRDPPSDPNDGWEILDSPPAPTSMVGN